MSNLRTWRKAKDLSRAALGEKLGVTAVAIGRYEQGRVPEPAVLQRLIEVTDGEVTANDFFNIPETSEPSQAAA